MEEDDHVLFVDMTCLKHDHPAPPDGTESPAKTYIMKRERERSERDPSAHHPKLLSIQSLLNIHAACPSSFPLLLLLFCYARK